MSRLNDDVQLYLDRYEPAESSYHELHEFFQPLDTVALSRLNWSQLTRLLELSWDYLYGEVGVMHKIGDVRWSTDRKWLVEAEQHTFQRRLRRARREWVKALYRQPSRIARWVDSIPEDYREVALLHGEKGAGEVIVQVPFVYVEQSRALIHDLIIVLYEGPQKTKNLIRFRHDGNTRKRDDLRRCIQVAKEAAFDYHNEKRLRFGGLRRLDHRQYNVEVYIDDYPEGEIGSQVADDRSFSGKSFTLAVSVGVCACLMARKVPNTVAFSAVVSQKGRQLLPVDASRVKARASCLSQINTLIICTNGRTQELEANVGILEAQMIHLRQGEQRNAEVLTRIESVQSLDDALNVSLCRR